MRNLYWVLFLFLGAVVGLTFTEMFDPSSLVMNYIILFLCLLLVVRYFLRNFSGQKNYSNPVNFSKNKKQYVPIYRRAIEAFEEKAYERAVKELTPLAKDGDISAQYLLGGFFSQRKDMFKNDTTAVKWFKQAARQGMPQAQYAVGECYYRGEGIVQSYQKAREAFECAADQNYPEAHFSLGMIYAKGQGVPVDYQKAFDYLLISAKAGVEEAQRNLAEMYYHGLGVKADKKKAMKWTKRAARQGDPAAEHNLALAYQSGEAVWKNTLLSKLWFRRSRQSFPLKVKDIWFKAYGITPERMSFNEENQASIVSNTKKLAEQGKAEAQFELGQLYFQGHGIQANETMAHRWWYVAAQQGHPEAQKQLAKLNRAYPA